MGMKSNSSLPVTSHGVLSLGMSCLEPCFNRSFLQLQANKSYTKNQSVWDPVGFSSFFPDSGKDAVMLMGGLQFFAKFL